MPGSSPEAASAPDVTSASGAGDPQDASNGERADSADWERREPSGPSERRERVSWAEREPGGAPSSWAPPPPGGPPPRDDEPFLPGKGLSAEPPAPPEPPVARPRTDTRTREALADAFMADFAGSATWRATLAVLDGAFPGRGMASELARNAGELWRAADALDRRSMVGLGVPAWLDDAGMVFDLSAHLGARAVRTRERPGRPRASRPYAGAFVVDTLDPLRYHRAVGGPRAPRDLAGEGTLPVTPAEDEDSGVVIVADLTAAGARVLDSAALWRHAGRVVTGALHEEGRPETRQRVRRALWALRSVVFVDPELGLGMCLRLDGDRVPRCLLAFGVDRAEGAPRFVRP